MQSSYKFLSWLYTIFESLKRKIFSQSNEQQPQSESLADQLRYNEMLKHVKDEKLREKRRRHNIRARNGLDEGFIYSEDPEEFDELMDRYITKHDIKAKKEIKEKFGLDLDKVIYGLYH